MLKFDLIKRRSGGCETKQNKCSTYAFTSRLHVAAPLKESGSYHQVLQRHLLFPQPLKCGSGGLSQLLSRANTKVTKKNLHGSHKSIYLQLSLVGLAFLGRSIQGEIVERKVAQGPFSTHAIAALHCKPPNTTVTGTIQANLPGVGHKYLLGLAGEKLSPEADGHCYNSVLQGYKQHSLGGDADLPSGQLMPWEIQKPLLKKSFVFRLKGETKEKDNFGCFFQHYDVSKSLSSSLNNCSLASVHLDCCTTTRSY